MAVMKRGALTVEAALFLPLLVFLLLAGAESGWRAWRSHQVQLAARQGAMVAASAKGTEELARVAVTDALERAGLGHVPFQTEVFPADVRALAPGQRIDVVIRLPYRCASLTGLSRLPFVPAELRCEAWAPKRGPHRPAVRTVVAVDS